MSKRERYAVHVGNIGCVTSGEPRGVGLTMARRIAEGYRGQIIRNESRAEWPVWIERLSDGAPVMEWHEAADRARYLGAE